MSEAQTSNAPESSFWGRNFLNGGGRLDYSRIAYAAVTYFVILFFFSIGNFFIVAFIFWAFKSPIISIGELQTLGATVGGAAVWVQGFYMIRRKQMKKDLLSEAKTIATLRGKTEPPIPQPDN